MGRKRAVPFVTALLAVPLVSHPRRDVCPGYPCDTASLPGHHRSYNRSQFLDFFGRPSAYVSKFRQAVIMRADHVANSVFFTSTSLAAMCEMVTVAISAVGRGSPEPFGYRIPRVTDFTDGSEEIVCHLNNKTN
jgi:hypothetical protein